MDIKPTKKIWTYLSVLALVGALGLSITQIPKKQFISSKASGGVVLSMIKDKANLQKGEDFTIDILLDAKDTQATHADIYLTYPENVVQAEEVSVANFFPDAVEPAAVGQGTTLIRLSSATPQKGGGIIASVKFKAVDSGTPAIQFSNETVVMDKTQKDQVANLVDKAIGLKFNIK